MTRTEHKTDKMEKGIALYNIELDGCLNGVYTYDGINGTILNEIARKKTKKDKGELCGIYDSSYFDTGNFRHKAILTIGEGEKGTYTFIWKVVGKEIVYEGTGYKMNEKQIVVKYEERKK